ncbi:MAG: ABC transporter permease subunit [Spirochaetes bacterium]|jgi:ABC-type glycerol-3-phosphate transport system permease component|nr:ABC transporter permease subunit [Spirochaetota bacterium]
MNTLRIRNTRAHLPVSILITAVIAVFALLPLYWIFVTSLKVPGTEFRLPLEYWPAEVSFESYRQVLGEGFRVQRAILNSLFVSTTAMIGTLFLGSLAAYTMARLRFHYRFGSLLFIQAAGMIPPIIVIGPTFVLLKNLGLLGSLWAMVLPNMAYGVPLAALLMTGYLSGIPYSIEEAARIDGASWMRIFYSIVLPVAAPGLFSAGVLSFLGSWGEFMHAFTVSLGIRELQTVPVAVLSYSQAFELQWTWISAATVLAIIPVVALVVVFQRYVVSGLTGGAVEG